MFCPRHVHRRYRRLNACDSVIAARARARASPVAEVGCPTATEASRYWETCVKHKHIHYGKHLDRRGIGHGKLLTFRVTNIAPTVSFVTGFTFISCDETKYIARQTKQLDVIFFYMYDFFHYRIKASISNIQPSLSISAFHSCFCTMRSQ